MAVKKKYVFVLRDKGTKIEGWWLKVSNEDELKDYYEQTGNLRVALVGANFLSQNKHKDKVTEAVIIYSGLRHLSFWKGLDEFFQTIAKEQLEFIMKYGAIYINVVGGYHFHTDEVKEIEIVERDRLVFPVQM